MTLPAGLLDRVRSRIAAAPGPATEAVVAEAVRTEAGGMLGDTDLLHMLRVLQTEFAGAGPLEVLLADPQVSDVLVADGGRVWVDRGGGLEATDQRFPDEDAVRRLAVRLASSAGRRLDEAQPWVDAALPRPAGAETAVRLHAVLAPIAVDGTAISLRVLRQAGLRLAQLGALGSFEPAMTALLRRVVAQRLSFLVVGGTGAGKTTLLAALLAEVAPHERIVVIEDAAELAPVHPHVIRLAARAANIEGAGQISLRQLVPQALRMRPDRLVIGEVRGAEVIDLLTALNTGHDGGAGTVHANAVAEVPARLEALAALGGLGRSALHSQLAAAVRLVLLMRRGVDGSRRLAELGVVTRGPDASVRVVTRWRIGEPVPRSPDELLGGAP